MKMKKYVFSSLLILCGMGPALASDCTGAECDFNEIMYSDTVSAPAGYIAPTPIAAYNQPTEYIYATQIPMRSVKTLSIKPVPEDTRPALWDGSNDKNVRYAGDKTVDPRDGVPIWDDSIAHYQRKDFSDWFLEPLPEIYMREVDAPTYEYDTAVELYNQNMADAAATRARIDELLEPQRPRFDLWSDATGCNAQYSPSPDYTAVDMTEMVSAAFGASDGCPFDTETECEIWRRKPIVRETVSPRSPTIRADALDAFVSAAGCNPGISATDAVAAPLLDRYKMLMRSANACCTDGLVYSLKRAGASDGLVYKFMSDDANFYGFGSRCLMMTDDELDTKYPNTATAAVAADVRNGCLCRGRQWFAAMLAPFQQVYAAAPEFANQKFYYTYTDGLQRQTTVSVNNDVQNVLKQLELCP